MPSDPAVAHPAVQQLLAEYTAYVDSRDLDGITQLFTETAQLIIGATEYQGREAIRNFYASAPVGIHLGAHPAIWFGADGLTATTVQNYFFLRDGSNATVRGVYRDLVRAEGNLWRFVKRHVEIRPAGGA